MDNVPINREFVLKFLRVCLDENIFWKHHINIISTKVWISIEILYRIRCILYLSLRKELCFSFINYYLSCAYKVWVSTNKSKVQALYRHQKHAARIINFKDKFTSGKPLLDQINAMAVYEMDIFKTLCFMYLCKNRNTPSIFKHIR